MSAAGEVIAAVIGAVLAAALTRLVRGDGSATGVRRHPKRTVAILAIGFFAAYTTIALLKLNAFNMGSEDLGRIDQAIWSVTEGRPLEFSASELGRPMSRMAGHIELLYFPLALAFYVWNGAAALLVVHIAVVAIGAIPAFRIGRRLGGDGLGVAGALAYLAHPAIGFATLADLHGDTLALPFLLAAIDYALAEQRSRSLVALAFAVAAKEYVALLAITFGLYFWLARGDRKLGSRAITLGVLWLVVVVPLFHLALRPPDFPQLTRVYYGKLGATPAEVVWTGLSEPWRVLTEIVTAKKVGVIAVWLAPFAFLGIAGGEWLLLTLPVLIPLAASEQLDLRNHHGATLMPFLLVAGLVGARRVCGRGAALAIVAATIVMHVNVAPSPFSFRSWTPGRWDFLPNPQLAGRTAHDAVVHDLLSQIPPQAAVSASGHLTPWLTHRTTCFAFPAPESRTAIDWVIVDLVGGYPPRWRPRLSELQRLSHYLTDPEFTVVDAKDGVFLLRRGDRPAALAPEPRIGAALTLTVGPLRLERDHSGRIFWSAIRDLTEPILVIDAESRAVRLAASAPLAPTPWPAGWRIRDDAPFPADRRLEVWLLREGWPSLQPASPPQPWLPDCSAGERLVPGG